MKATVKYNKSEILKEAHKIARTFEGDYKACLAEGLRISWEEAMYVAPKPNYSNCTVKDIFDIINEDFRMKNSFEKTGEYSEYAEYIFETVKNNSKGFQADIAKEAYFMGKKLSTKQAWCVAYEFKNVA